MKDLSRSGSELLVTTDRSGLNPIDSIMAVTKTTDIGIDIKFPEFLTRLIKPITAPCVCSLACDRVALLFGP